MPDPESQFLDALYLSVRDLTEFDQALTILCGLFSGGVAAHYEREFAHLDPAPPAFMKRPPGTAIPTYRLLPEEKRRPGIFFSEFFRPLGLEEVWEAPSLPPMAGSPWSGCIAVRTARHSTTTTSPSSSG